MKVLDDMLSAATGDTYLQSPPKRTLLDVHHWERYDLTLFYEGKRLCLELSECLKDTSGDEHRQIGQWAFCADSRHLERVDVGTGCTIDIAYRPAHISVSFCACSKGGFLKRWIHAMDRVHWSEYQLRPDGLVSVTRPGEEVVVG
jgi:hypothetical protein